MRLASLLYLDYPGRKEWIPNIYGGRENIEAIAFLRRFNEEATRNHPDIQTMAEKSTDWPMRFEDQLRPAVWGSE